MKQIACLYTVYSVIESFSKQLKDAVPEGTKIHTLYDDFLATDPAELGRFTEVNLERLRCDLRACALTGADLIVVTCSTITPAVRALRSQFSVPILAIDDIMMKQAVRLGTRIGLIATANSTKEPSTDALLAAAGEAGKEIELETRCNEAAILALKAGRAEEHDRLVFAMAEELRDRDVLVLAQASTAYLAPRLTAKFGIPVISSPELCVKEACRLLAL